MKKTDIIPALIWIVLGMYVAAESWWSLKVGTLGLPGSGLLPFLLGIILVLVSLPILVRSLLMIKNEVAQGGEGIWVGIDFKKIIIVIACLIVYAIILEKIGYLVLAFFVLLILFKTVGSQKWSSVLILSLVTVTITYFLFIVLLKVELPAGLLRIG